MALNQRKTLLILIFILAFAGFSFDLHAVETKSVKNFGFIPSTIIWYSKDPFFAGDRIRIYSAVFNGSEYDVTGTMQFYDSGILIGKSDFAVARGGRLMDVWVDWTVTKGSHKISARIVNTKISTPEGGSEEIILENSQTEESERFAEEIPEPAAEKEKSAQKQESALNQEGILGGIVDVIPSGLVSVATSVIQTINTFADEQKEKLEEQKEKLREEIAEMEAAEGKDAQTGDAAQKGSKTITFSGSEGASSNKAEKSIKYFFIAALSAATSVLGNKILLYILLLIIFWKTVEFLFKKIFRFRRS